MKENRLGEEKSAECSRSPLARSEDLPCSRALLEGAVHDFNNLLQVILAMAAIIRSKLCPQSPLGGHVQVIEQCAVRAAALSQKLRAFILPGEPSREVLDLGAFIRDAVRAIRWALPPVRLEVKTVESPVWVMADAAKLVRAILELCEGSYRGAGAGGRLELALEHRVATATGRLELSLEGGEAPSLPALHRAAEMLESQGGRLDVTTAPGDGPRIAVGITFPTVAVSPPPGTGFEAHESSEAGFELNGAVRDLLAGMLRDLGCVVVKLSKPSGSEPGGASQ